MLESSFAVSLPICKLAFERPVKVRGIGVPVTPQDTGGCIMGIEFTDGTGVEGYHYRYCCERVSASWEGEVAGIRDREFNKLEVRGLPDCGIALNGYIVKFFMYRGTCGHFGADLRLLVRMGGKVHRFFIDDYVEGA